jgi:hypothetical protein
MLDVHVPHPFEDAGLPRFRIFGNGHNCIAQRWKAGDLLLHQSRAANKRPGLGPAAALQFRPPRSRASVTIDGSRTAAVARTSSGASNSADERAASTMRRQTLPGFCAGRRNSNCFVRHCQEWNKARDTGPWAMPSRPARIGAVLGLSLSSIGVPIGALVVTVSVLPRAMRFVVFLLYGRWWIALFGRLPVRFVSGRLLTLLLLPGCVVALLFLGSAIVSRRRALPGGPVLIVGSFCHMYFSNLSPTTSIASRGRRTFGFLVATTTSADPAALARMQIPYQRRTHGGRNRAFFTTVRERTSPRRPSKRGP